MSLREMCDQAHEMAKGLKDDEVRDYHGDNRMELSINPVIQGWRGASPVIVMTPMDVDRDQALRAAWICAQGFGCDAIAMSTDAWSAKGARGKADINPVTGKRWGRNEMQDVVLNHEGIEKGWIVEGLMTYAVNRAGDVAGRTTNYLTTKRTSALGIPSWSIEWGENWASGPGGQQGMRTEGLIVSELVRYMNMRTTGQFVASLGLTGRDFDLDDVEAQAHADAAIVKTLRIAGFEGALMLMSDDDRRQRVLDESLGHLRLRGL